ncbi:twitching motility protein PilT [Arthrobacter crystallopoietes BAB-32]|uniref:Ribonuclease VapC n=1 Tax=Arthrobacter crystallopoietes BAB-32 TaxID=1246476 RepID=N1UXZ5_9MICC|nr:type II toxin-antitoxin system VapC family toxin [Arthrobacter crystallopoietes]EMY33925.1 twitching motility protein PilT [Arthrobacter crystallopoietes BAB-32]
MKVLDATVVIALLLGDVKPEVLGHEDLAAPHLLDSEVASVLRRLVRRQAVTEEQAAVALDGHAQLSIRRFPALPLIPRIWQLRANLSAYDATYVALAEELDAASLLTVDRRLARAPGIRCLVEVV